MLVQRGTASPMIIWDRKTLQADMTKGELPGTIYGLSSKGWTDPRTFLRFGLSFHFLRYAPPIRPILLLMDGHSSHYCLMQYFDSQGEVILFTLPPNTSHLTQPLDKGCFGPLKVNGVKLVMILWLKILVKLSVDIPFVQCFPQLGCKLCQ